MGWVYIHPYFVRTTYVLVMKIDTYVTDPNFFNCCLAASWSILGHYQGGSLTHPMLLAFYVFDLKVTRSLVAINTNWISQITHSSCQEVTSVPETDALWLKVVSTKIVLVYFVCIKEQLWNKKRKIFHFESSFHSWYNQFLNFQIFECDDAIKCQGMKHFLLNNLESKDSLVMNLVSLC